jgi:hypothetical protein
MRPPSCNISKGLSKSSENGGRLLATLSEIIFLQQKSHSQTGVLFCRKFARGYEYTLELFPEVVIHS